MTAAWQLDMIHPLMGVMIARLTAALVAGRAATVGRVIAPSVVALWLRPGWGAS